MNEKIRNLGGWLLGIPVLIFLGGVLISILLFRSSGIGTYPALIAKAYREEQHHLNVPGAMEVKLTRTGAYGIYYEYSLVRSIYSVGGRPPLIDCSLTSESTGAMIEAVPDYVKTNRYRSRDLHAGVLIMSLTVEKPGTYTFACDNHDGRTEPEIMVALGPNYFWEFLRIAWKIGFPVLGGISILCGSVLLALLLLATGLVIKLLYVSKFPAQN